ncbi:MAG: metallophosphoesterase family protein [Lachnospiraceae bacterium]|nr:metallophosphoesterase family protein [Lachnospiraceae bacterium]
MSKKIVIVSDTHGRCETLERVMRIESPMDMLIHLGDVCSDEDYIEAIAHCPTVMIAGNNDYLTHLPRTKALRLGNASIHMEHGHRFSMGTSQIVRDAKDLGVNVMMYGHTHVPVLEKHDGIWLVNPGSLTYPRQQGMRPTYIVMTLEEDGEPCFELRYL